MVFQLIWQQVGDPDETAAPGRIVEYLRGCIVMTKWFVYDSPDKAPLGVIYIDNKFPNHLPIAERHSTRTGLKFSVGDKTRYQPCMQRTDIPECIPNDINRYVNDPWAKGAQPGAIWNVSGIDEA